jgi:general secretion pathway protein D
MFLRASNNQIFVKFILINKIRKMVVKSKILEITLLVLPLTAAPVWAQSPEPTTPATASDKQDDAKPTAQPRFIKGNDVVLASPKAAPALMGSPTSFKFEDAPVADFANIVLKDLLKADYVLHPPLNGTVTLSTNAEVSPDQALILLEAALQANGLTLARDTRGTYHIGKPDVLKTVVPAVRQFVPGSALPPGTGPIIVRLNYIGAAEMASILRPMLPPDALIRVDSVRNLIVLAGTRTQAEGWLDLVSTFDIDLLKGMSVGVFPLKYATTQEIEAAMRSLAPSGAPSMPGANPAQPAARPGDSGGAAPSVLDSNPLAGALRVIPIERINSVMVVTPRAAYLEEARRWIEKLDQPSDGGNAPQLFIYQVQNVNARHLASVLSGIFGDGKTAATTTPGTGIAPGLSPAVGVANNQGFGAFGGSGTGFGGGAVFGGGMPAGNTAARPQSGFASNSLMGRTAAPQAAPTPAPVASLGNIRVMADELNNSVLVWSTKNEYEKIEATLKRLDLPLTQVLIEASIVEVTLTDGLEFGLQWAFNDSRSSGSTGRGVLSVNGGGALGPAREGFSYTFRNPLGDIRAVLNALSKKTSVKVIASPSLMVLDNHSASINVGNQTPIQVGESVTSDGIIRTTVQYKDTGVSLMVTPSVNSGNVVTMQVEQSVTDVGAADNSTGQPNFLQRQLSSKLAVRSGESIVMGGLIQENGTSSKSGVPILHKLPVVGNLFGSTETTSNRTELIVIITPRVVRTDVDIQQVSTDLRNRMQGLPPLNAVHQVLPAKTKVEERNLPLPTPSQAAPDQAVPSP